MTAPPSQSMSWSVSLAITAVAIEFCVSANALTWLGIPYVTEGGFLPEKLHPGTYLLCLAFVIRGMSQTRLDSKMWCLLGGDKKLVIYFGCLSVCLVYMVMTTGAGNMVVLLDTFLPAGMLACIVRDASSKELNVLLCVFQCGVCLNAALALAEAAAHVTLIPLYLNEVEYHAVGGEFRPTAFYDHPLTGGVMTLMGLATAPRSHAWRFGYLVLAGAALIAFGGRVAVAAAMVSAVTMAGTKLVSRVLHRSHIAFQFMLQCSLYLAISVVTTVAALGAGFGERLLGHLYWDPSAQIRLTEWSLLKDLTRTQLIFGTKREDLLDLLTPLWLQSGVEQIENFWLLMFVSLGAVGFTVFVLGFSTFLVWCWQRTGLRGRILLLSVMAVVSTSNSLGRKSTLLVGLVAAIACNSEWWPSQRRKILAPAIPKVRGVFVPADR